MSARTHTPGPWEVYWTESDGLWITNQTRNTVIDTAKPDIHPLSDADAHLIAAAPELLEACREALDDLERINHSYQCGESPTWDLLRTAINRAEGRAE